MLRFLDFYNKSLIISKHLKANKNNKVTLRSFNNKKSLVKFIDINDQFMKGANNNN